MLKFFDAFAPPANLEPVHDGQTQERRRGGGGGGSLLLDHCAFPAQARCQPRTCESCNTLIQAQGSASHPEHVRIPVDNCFVALNGISHFATVSQIWAVGVQHGLLKKHPYRKTENTAGLVNREPHIKLHHIKLSNQKGAGSHVEAPGKSRRPSERLMSPDVKEVIRL